MTSMFRIHPQPAFNFSGLVIDNFAGGKRLSKAAQVRMCGNSVYPPVAAALVRANLVEQQQIEEAA